jgi:hypothetical protein
MTCTRSTGETRELMGALEMADVDEEEMAYYLELCERLRACRRTHRDRRTFTRSLASEEQILAVEAKLGFSLPPLLRMIYLEVADGGLGIIDDDWEKIVASGDLSQVQCRKGWRLHPCIERALQHYQFSYVRCDAWPEHFLYIAPTGHCDLVLDADTGWVYQSEFEGVLPPRRKGERIDLWSLGFVCGSLWELCERWLERSGFGQPPSDFFNTHDIPHTGPAIWGELSPELLDPANLDNPELIWNGLNRGVQPKLLDPSCYDDPALIWNGLYPGVEPIMWSPWPTDMHPFEEIEHKLANYVPPGGWPEE